MNNVVFHIYEYFMIVKQYMWLSEQLETRVAYFVIVLSEKRPYVNIFRIPKLYFRLASRRDDIKVECNHDSFQMRFHHTTRKPLLLSLSSWMNKMGKSAVEFSYHEGNLFNKIQTSNRWLSLNKYCNK